MAKEGEQKLTLIADAQGFDEAARKVAKVTQAQAELRGEVEDLQQTSAEAVKARKETTDDRERLSIRNLTAGFAKLAGAIRVVVTLLQLLPGASIAVRAIQRIRHELSEEIALRLRLVEISKRQSQVEDQRVGKQLSQQERMERIAGRRREGGFKDPNVARLAQQAAERAQKQFTQLQPEDIETVFSNFFDIEGLSQRDLVDLAAIAGFGELDVGQGRGIASLRRQAASVLPHFRRSGRIERFMRRETLQGQGLGRPEYYTAQPTEEAQRALDEAKTKGAAKVTARERLMELLPDWLKTEEAVERGLKIFEQFGTVEEFGRATRLKPTAIFKERQWEVQLRDQPGYWAKVKEALGHPGKVVTLDEPTLDAYMRAYYQMQKEAAPGGGRAKPDETERAMKEAAEADARGWRWFGKLSTCQAWDMRTRNDRALVLNREGEHAYTQKAGAYIELDPESFAPGECWVGDEKTFDVWVRTPRGKVVRPVLSAWHDWRSRTVVSFRISETGNEDTLVASFAEGADGFGLPAHVIVDNGRSYSGWVWRGNRPKRRTYRRAGEPLDSLDGIFALCGIEASWCLPFNPNGKARLERWYRSMDSQICVGCPSYAGRRPDERPEAHSKLVKKAVEWDVFVGVITRYVAAYNNRPHSGEGMGGRTPLQVMALAPRKRLLDPNIRPLLLAKWHRPVSIGRNGVAIQICGKTERYGVREPELRELPIGTKVRVSYDPDDTGKIAVWRMDGRFMCHAELNQRLNRKVPSEALRRVMREKRREQRTLKEARRVGLDHLRDPMERAVASLEHDSAKRRLPDPPDGGGPVLVPVQTPLEAPPMRKAVGAEGMDALDRFQAFARKPAVKQGGSESVWNALDRFNNRSQSDDR